MPRSSSRSNRATDPNTLPLSFEQLVTQYIDFLETAIHTLLYVRQVYPSELFLRRQRWGVVVQMARHEGVRAWVGKSLEVIGKQLIEGNARTVVLIFMSAEGFPSERWLFQFDDVDQISKSSDERRKTDPIRKPNAPTKSTLEPVFRRLLLQMIATGGALSPLNLSDESTHAPFTLLLEDPAPGPHPSDDDLTPALERFTSNSIGQRIREGELKQTTLALSEIENGVLDMEIVVQTLQ
ncbi:Mitotic spindle checkpoint protein [Phaffia rhodozyma]|uniref:Mitotic spindle checkpoint protein n=1 Tax=Phaffia rhodozyma TaxID=264483 RepID=A0A0F7ST24_PHARH|nr:Mitotic spindle checkpoint protein [Phaffia rhodozyma]